MVSHICLEMVATGASSSSRSTTTLIAIAAVAAVACILFFASSAAFSSTSSSSSLDSFSSLYDRYDKYLGHQARKGNTVVGKVKGHNMEKGFWIECPDMTADSEMLPFANTCLSGDGGVSPALSWGGAPEGTVQYMITMSSHSDNPDTSSCSRYEWVLYGIDASVTSIPAGNTAGVGIAGGSFPGVPKYEYAVPCPDGTGFKTYYITVYALSGDLASFVAAQTDDYYRKVGPELLLEANSQSMVTASAQFTAKVCFQGCVETDADGMSQVVINADDDGECI